VVLLAKAPITLTKGFCDRLGQGPAGFLRDGLGKLEGFGSSIMRLTLLRICTMVPLFLYK
jgi:hypothetical protein